MSHRGLMISLEGGEGAGKSTLLGNLRQWLNDEHDIDPLMTREPGGTTLGEGVRNLVLDADHASLCAESELLLMFAARAQLVRDVLQPALDDGRVILCDRFTDASYAYQGGGRGQPLQRIADLEQWAAEGLQPDLTLLLDVPPKIGRERIVGRGEPDRIEQEGNAFFERVHDAYRARAAAQPQRFRILDGRDDPAQVQAQARKAIAPLLTGWQG